MALPRIGTATALPLVPAWLLLCYFLIVVVGGVIANVLLLVTAVRWRCRPRSGSPAPGPTERCDEGADGDPEALAGDAPQDDAWTRDRDRGWWLLLCQLAATDALALALVAGGELWTVRETGGPWRLPGALCAPFMGLEAMLGAAQTYLLVALALHARAVPADPVPSVSVWRHVSQSAVMPSALVWMLASSVAVPRTFLAVTVWPRPSLPLCTLLPTSPSSGALEGPLDVVGSGPGGGPGPSGSWWPLAGTAEWTLTADNQGGGPLLTAIVLCAAPTLVLLATTLATALATAFKATSGPGSRARTEPPVCPPHKLTRREWIRVTTWLSASWLLLSLPRLASAAAHGFMPPDAVHEEPAGLGHHPEQSGFGPWAFRAPPLGSRVLDDVTLLAASMLHYALTAARPVIAVLASPALRRAALGLFGLPDGATASVPTDAPTEEQRLDNLLC